MENDGSFFVPDRLGRIVRTDASKLTQGQDSRNEDRFLEKWTMMDQLELTTLPSEYEGPTFDKFLDEQTEFFIESMQDAADNYWHELSGNEI